MSDDVSDLVSIGGENVSLSDLAGFDLGSVQELRGALTPVGTFRFSVKEGKLAMVTTKNGPTAGVAFTFLIKEVLAVVPPDGMDSFDEDSLINTEHRHTFFIMEAKDLGRVKAFLIDIGYQGSGALQDLLHGSVDHEFIGSIKQTRDRDDKDKIYANLRLDKLKPIAA